MSALAPLDRPVRRRANTADWDRGRTLYPGMDDPSEKWAELLVAKPDVLWTLIADIVKVAKAAEGPRRTGRRPLVSGLTLDEVWATIHPDRFSLEPFPAALAQLMAARSYSQRSFARRLPWHRTTLSRLMTGQLVPDLQVLEIIAAAAGVPPAYFAEYRACKLGTLVLQILTDNPHLSVTMFKRLARGTDDRRH